MCPVQVAKAIEDWIEEQVMQLDDNKCALLGHTIRSRLLFGRSEGARCKSSKCSGLGDNKCAVPGNANMDGPYVQTLPSLIRIMGISGKRLQGAKLWYQHVGLPSCHFNTEHYQPWAVVGLYV